MQFIICPLCGDVLTTIGVNLALDVIYDGFTYKEKTPTTFLSYYCPKCQAIISNEEGQRISKLLVDSIKQSYAT